MFSEADVKKVIEAAGGAFDAEACKAFFTAVRSTH